METDTHREKEIKTEREGGGKERGKERRRKRIVFYKRIKSTEIKKRLINVPSIKYMTNDK